MREKGKRWIDRITKPPVESKHEYVVVWYDKEKRPGFCDRIRESRNLRLNRNTSMLSFGIVSSYGEKEILGLLSLQSSRATWYAESCIAPKAAAVAMTSIK